MSLLSCSICVVVFAVCCSYTEVTADMSKRSYEALEEKYNKLLQNVEKNNQQLERITSGLRRLCSDLTDMSKEGKTYTPVESPTKNKDEHPLTLQAKLARAETTAESIMYVVEYESPSEPFVLWKHPSTMRYMEVIFSTESDVITNEFDGKRGKTTLLTSDKEKLHPIVTIETELDYISLNLVLPKNNKSVLIEQEVPAIEMEVITDQEEASYTDGDIVTFNVTVAMADTSAYSLKALTWDFITINQSSTPPSLAIIYEDERESENIFISMVKSVQSDAQITHVYTTDTGKLDVGGILYFNVYAHKKKKTDDILIETVSGGRSVILKQVGYTGPFPDDFASFYNFNKYEPHRQCRKHDKCVITCRAIDARADPDLIRLVSEDGLKPEFPTIQKTAGYLHDSFFLVENMTLDKEGEYQCLLGTPVAASTQVTLTMREPVKILKTSGIINRTQKSMTIMCAAQGAPAPRLTVTEHMHGYALTEVDDDNVSVERSSTNGVTMVTITISNFDKSRYATKYTNFITCEASNKYDYMTFQMTA